MTFQQILLRRGIRFRTGVSDHNKILLCCPFCPERGKETDTRFLLCVHASQGWGRCMHCEWKSRRAVLSVLRQLLITDVVSGFDVSEEAGPALPVVLPRDFTLLTRTYDDLDRAAQQYLLDRGITKEQIRENHLGISYSGRYAYRILFPVYVAKTLKGIVARDFTGCQKPKYLNSPGEKYLYHFNPAVETCIFSEGVFKALRIQQATLCGSAALLGHDLTSAQISQIIGSRCKRVIFYPDPDRVGRRGVVSMADKLIEAWGGEIKIICKVFRPADEDELSNIKKNLTNAVAYGWDVRQRTLLQS